LSDYYHAHISEFHSTADPATVTLTSFNTALPAGSVLASFTANTTKNNPVAFTMSTLTPGKRYFVKVGDTKVETPVADTTGMIQFSHSSWPADVFTVVEDASTTPPGSSISDLNNDGVVDEKDMDIVLLHWRNETSPQYPNYEINKDGIVDVLDMEYVTRKIPLSLVDRVLAFLNSLF
jgi:hypothetical protein